MANIQEQNGTNSAIPVSQISEKSDPVFKISSVESSLPAMSQTRSSPCSMSPSQDESCSTAEVEPTRSKVASSPAARSSQDGSKKQPGKRNHKDFVFGTTIGEGSFSTVYLAKEIETNIEYAIKVCDKDFIVKRKKAEYIMREKEVLTRTNHPFIIKLSYTFQDVRHLYFVLQYARNKELLYYLNKLSCFDMKCSQFYAAEIVEAVDYLQSIGVIHRDLKPENILLNDKMHIMITDFGSAKIVNKKEEGKSGQKTNDVKVEKEAEKIADDTSDKKADKSKNLTRKNSFVGTAQYVSPEVAKGEDWSYGTDLWALGCIIYQFLSGATPFHANSEYAILIKVNNGVYEMPEGFNPVAADLVKQLLVLEPHKRIGCREGGMKELRQHKFFEGVVWEGLEEQQAPELMPYLPATTRNEELWSSQTRAGLDERRQAEIIISGNRTTKDQPLQPIPGDEHKKKLEEQRTNNEYHSFVEDNLILKQGKVLKRKGLFARKRMLLLTEGPHLYYVDYSAKVLKGEIPWSKSLRPEAKDFRVFFVHTPNRTYYLESRDSQAQEWEAKINEVWQHYYGKRE